MQIKRKINYDIMSNVFRLKPVKGELCQSI